MYNRIVSTPLTMKLLFHFQEFSKLRQENSYLRSKLRKAEHEVEEIKVAHIAVKDEKERLKKQVRGL